MKTRSSVRVGLRTMPAPATNDVPKARPSDKLKDNLKNITNKTEPEKRPSAVKRQNESNLSELPQSPQKKHSKTTLCTTSTGESSSVNNECTVDVPSAELKYYYTLKKVLGRQYCNVKDRLQLDFQPTCLLNLVECRQNHSKNKLNIHEIDNFLANDAKTILREDKPLDFLRLVSNITLSNNFPGHSLVLSVLELILSINTPSHKSYKTDEIIRNAAGLYGRILNNFPPCWQDTRKSYLKMLIEPLRLSFSKNKFDASDGIFRVVLSMLQSVLEENEQFQEKVIDSMSDSQLDMDFHSFEMKSLQKYEFDQLRRDDKIERIFIVLHLLVQLLEWDLAMWLFMHSVDKTTVQINEDNMPIINSFLWNDPNNCYVNVCVKKIIELFVICIKVAMPQDKIDIMARLMNVICNAVNLCELQNYLPEVEFPNIKNRTEALVDQIIKNIRGMPATNINAIDVDLFLAVIDNVRNPIVRLTLIDKLLVKFNPHPVKMSLKKIFENMAKQRWLECDADGTRNRIEYNPKNSLTTSIYPVYECNAKQKEKKKSQDIFQHDYLALILNFFQTYLTVYRTDEIFIALKSDLYKVNCVEATTVAGERKRLSEYENKCFNFKQLAADIRVLESKFMSKAAKSRVVYQNVEAIFLEILVNAEIALHHRDDLKYYCLLGDLIKQYQSEYGEAFDEWLKYF